VVDLDAPPRWFADHQARDHMTAAQAREFAGTDGALFLFFCVWCLCCFRASVLLAVTPLCDAAACRRCSQLSHPHPQAACCC
jgi:hypothetical protein